LSFQIFEDKLMHKIYIFLLASFLVNVTASYASNTVDSIGVENNKGKKLIVHRVEAKETYYSIAKKYSVNYKDIMTFNENKFLQIGVIVKVPTAQTFGSDPTPKANNVTEIEYTIKAKDNLNMLAEKFGTTVDAIKSLNGLKSINLQIGQVLKIPTNQSIAQNNSPVDTPPKEVEKAGGEEVDNTSIEHTIKAKENLNLIAEKYGTTVEEIKRLNGLTSNNLRIGQVLKIKGENKNVTTEPITPIVTMPVPKTQVKQEVTTNVADGNLEHIVLAGETIYSIASKYNQTTYQLKTANNLTSNEVSVGQKLIIKGPRSVAASNGEEETGNGNTIKDPSLRGAPSSYGIIQIEEKGRGVWIADPDLDPTKMLVLHRTAPVGTIIKVTNPMSNRSAFAKVVGKFTENESTKDVIIVMTKAVADAVGALDKRFLCNLTYGAQENEQ
jgi:peptidoglycan endopeptidase LytF